MRRFSRSFSFTVVVLVVALAALPAPGEYLQPDADATGEAGVRTALAQAGLPAPPGGWPSVLHLGMSDGAGGAAAMQATAPFGLRSQYLAGGANTGSGWATWNANGDFVTYYIQDSKQYGMIPVFDYYQLLQSSPSTGADEGQRVYNNLQNVGTMRAYYADLKLFMQKAGAQGSTEVVFHYEPDLWGFMQQQAAGRGAASIPAQVAATGVPELAGLPNNLAGFARAATVLRDRYAPNVRVGYHVSLWGTGTDITTADPPDAQVDALADKESAFYASLSTPFDLLFYDPLDRDAAFYQYQYGDARRWWAADDFRRNLRFLSRIVQQTQKRVLLWQVPLGNTKMRAQNNTWSHYQDNRVEWWLDDPTRAHLDEWRLGGVVGFIFGRGADGPTCACDANHDGVTNPAPINGNTGVSLNADDDGGFFRQKAAAYYQAGAMPLAGGGTTATPTPTRTPTRTPTSAAATPTATRTPTRTPTPIQAPASVQTVTFDDRPGEDQALDGQYPSGVINWGTNTWYHSGPWGAFTTKSASFNAAGVTNRSFTFVTPRRLQSIRVFNGGGASTTVSLSCSGQTTKTQVVAAGQAATVTTGWTGTCTTVTVSSTNGWDTNVDDLVHAAS